MAQLYVIECRKPDGSLDTSDPQPETVFGYGAIHGISEDEMANKVYAKLPDATLKGHSVSLWPSLIDSRWVASRKTWLGSANSERGDSDVTH